MAERATQCVFGSRTRFHQSYFLQGESCDCLCSWPVDDFVDNAIFFGLMSGHDEVALNIAFDPVEALAGVLGHQRVGDFADAQNLTGMNINVRRLPTQSTHGRLVDEDTRVRQSKPLALGSRQQQESAHAGSLSDAVRYN